MVDKLFTVYTNINIEMKTAVREGGVVLIILNERQTILGAVHISCHGALKCENC